MGDIRIERTGSVRPGMNNRLRYWRDRPLTDCRCTTYRRTTTCSLA